MVSVYFDFRDWWVGYYRGDEFHYVCLLPTLVMRWRRRLSLEERIRLRPSGVWRSRHD